MMLVSYTNPHFLQTKKHATLYITGSI